MSQTFVLFLALLTASAHAQHNAPKQIVLDLRAHENNPRNSEGDFVTLKDGRILFIYAKYQGEGGSDFAPADLVARYSSDDGETWTTEDKVVVENEGQMNVMSVSLLRLRDGRLALFYARKNSRSDNIPYVRYSTDEAETWTEPRPCITDQPGYYVMNNDRATQLKSRRIILPVSLHKTPTTEWSNRGTLRCYYSDDAGVNWQGGQEVPNPDSVIIQEPGVVELKDGRLLMYMRANGGVQYFSYSQDQGKTWSQIEPSTIASPISPASMARIPMTNDLLLVWNNNGAKGPGYFKGQRSPLTMAVSDDEGKTWRHLQNLEDDPEGTFCYTAIQFGFDEVLLAYSRGTGLPDLRIVRLKLDQLYD
ncbi:sialidase family protein [Persicitalea sp.]|uniref:sialidase family protein n=1 Tax=Persicitalea sp. TaxID=3100273 RepID=UPI003593CAD0